MSRNLKVLQLLPLRNYLAATPSSSYTSTRMATLLRSYRAAVRCKPHTLFFSASASSRVPRQLDLTTSMTQDTGVASAEAEAETDLRRNEQVDIVSFEDLEPAEVDDASSFGHLVLQQQRQLLYYMRLIEHEMPQLAGTQSDTPLSSITYEILRMCWDVSKLIENLSFRLRRHIRSSFVPCPLEAKNTH